MPPIDISFSVYSDFLREVLKHLEDVDDTLRKRSGAKTLSQLKKQNTELLKKISSHGTDSKQPD